MNNGNVIKLLDDKFLKRQKIAGNCVRACLNSCQSLINSGGNISLKDLEKVCLSQMKAFGCTPTFLNYHGFPSAICTSVNNQLVHGVVTDYVLKEGDVVTVDLGATFDGAIGDAARTWIFGKEKLKTHVELIQKCKESLTEAYKSIKVGSQLGVIGNSIFKTVKDSGFGLIVNYGGHFIAENTPHAEPFVTNKSNKNEGVRIQNGMTFAIEPLLVIGQDTTTSVGKDGWTVYTKNISAHFEDTFFVWEDKIHLITDI